MGMLMFADIAGKLRVVSGLVGDWLRIGEISCNCPVVPKLVGCGASPGSSGLLSNKEGTTGRVGPVGNCSLADGRTTT
jgi:hypothetical protein